MAELLARIARAQQGRPALHELPVDEARRVYARGAEVLDLPKADCWVEDLRLASVRAGAADALRARLYCPTAPSPWNPHPVLLFFHGGGFTLGSIDTHDSLARQLCVRSGAAVLSVDYRLAPEHRFPAAVDDAWYALQWLTEQGGAHGLDARRIAVGGDSAGGTLACVTAIHARDIGLPLALQLLFYPGTDAWRSLPSQRRFAHGHLLDGDLIDWFFDQYVGRGLEREDWRFAPLWHPDLRGLAPAWVGLAELDPVRDDGLAWAEALRRAAVPAEVALVRGVTHDFVKMGRFLPEARATLAQAASALRRALRVDD